MKYVNLQLGFKSGRTDSYRLEIEPHDLEDMKNTLKTLESAIYDYFDGVSTTPPVFFLDTMEGRLLIDIRQLESFAIDDTGF